MKNAALIGLLFLGVQVHAEEKQADAPRVTHLTSGDYLMNAPAYTALDSELKRMQAVERLHKDEAWGTAILVSALVGALAGASTVAIVVAVTAK